MVVSIKGQNTSESNRNSYQLSNSPGATYSPMEPLDLSRTSTMFPFAHPSTPEEKPNPSTIFRLNRQNSLMERQMSVDYTYSPPTIIIQPKSEWHYRNMRDLASKHIPLLSGNGPQRTPIRLSVPPKSDRPMFLSVQILTANHEPHPSKVIVPVKTQVKTSDRRHDNNLDCLDFSQCSETDLFNPVTRIIYSLITPEEHAVGQKDIRVYMFNLYQSQTITKELIETQQLHMCQLAFTLCYQDNGRYQPISESSFSSWIEEKRTVQSRSSPSMCSDTTSQSVPYPMMYVGQGSPDNTKENEIGFLIIPLPRSSS